MEYTHHYTSSTPAHASPAPSHAMASPAQVPPATSPLAAIYASYVVRVHTRHGIKTLSFDHLAAFFTLTAKKAAEDLGISSRTLIRVCRSLGIRRWPYLGFRSEKNVERIRQEAIENLRRKLEKDGAANPTAVMYPSASSLRGASAKRLLQVTSPQGHMSPLPSAHRIHTSPSGRQSWSVQSIDDTESEDDTDIEMLETRSSPSHASAPRHYQPLPLLTPQPMQHGFNLDLRRMSPKKPFALAHGAPAHWTPKIPASHQTQPSSRSVGAFQPPQRLMPSLSLLVDASIMTSFKHESSNQLALPSQQQQQQQCPRMSMRDILSHTAMAA